MVKKPKRRHPQPPVQRGPGLEEILSRARTLQEEGKLEEALQVLDEAPFHLQRRSEVLMLRGLLLAGLDRPEEAILTLEEAQRRDPDNLLIYYFLGMLYADQDMLAHARRALREVVEYREVLPAELVKGAQDVLEELEEAISQFARASGMPLAQMDEAEYELERGTRAMAADDFPTAIRHFRRAASIAPHWITPRGMEAEALMLDGRFREAMEAGRRLLAKHPDVVPLRELLVRTSIALGNREMAEEIARPLRTRSYDLAGELEAAIIALGYLNDDQGIYRLYQRHRDMVDEIESAPALIVLGSAAANLGHFWTASWLWELALDRGAVEVYLSPFFSAASCKAPGPGIADRYPTFQFSQFAPRQAAREMDDLVLSLLDGRIDQKSFQKRMRALVARHPVLFSQMIQVFREARSRAFPARLLAILGTPESLAELRQFAFSQKGKLGDRIDTLRALAEVGEIDPDQPVELWDEVRQEWRRLTIPHWSVIEAGETPSPPRWLELAQECDEALEAGQVQRAEELAEKALSVAPNDPDLYNWLAITWRDDPVKSEAYLRRAVELDPRHVGARTGLVLMALNRGDLAEARRHLEAVADQREFEVGDFLEHLYALAWVSLREGDLALARFYTDTAMRWQPVDDRFYELDWLVEARTPGSFLYLSRERSRKSREQRRTRPIQPNASLSECLGRLSRESLMAMARVHFISYSALRKEQLIQRLVEALTNPRTLERAVPGLSDPERQALREVLDAGGVLPWDEFTARYGSDVEESRSWYYREPETVMGRLRMYGLLSDGTVEGQRVVLVPAELRELLPPVLAAAAEEQPRDDAV